MVLKDSLGREVEVEFDSNNDGSVYIGSGTYVDSGELVPENELIDLEDMYPEVLDEVGFERMVMRAEDWADRDR
jgi:hypothetical protein